MAPAAPSARVGAVADAIQDVLELEQGPAAGARGDAETDLVRDEADRATHEDPETSEARDHHVHTAGRRHFGPVACQPGDTLEERGGREAAHPTAAAQFGSELVEVLQLGELVAAQLGRRAALIQAASEIGGGEARHQRRSTPWLSVKLERRPRASATSKESATGCPRSGEP